MTTDNVTGSPSSRRLNKNNRITCYSSLFEVERDMGLNDPALKERAMRMWDEATNAVLTNTASVRRLNQNILELGQYSRMLQRFRRRTQEAQDGVIIPDAMPARRSFQVLVLCPAHNEPATTLSDCCPVDLPSP